MKKLLICSVFFIAHAALAEKPKCDIDLVTRGVSIIDKSGAHVCVHDSVFKYSDSEPKYKITITKIKE